MGKCEFVRWGGFVAQDGFACCAHGDSGDDRKVAGAMDGGGGETIDGRIAALANSE